jgi:hypothetical protein
MSRRELALGASILVIVGLGLALEALISEVVRPPAQITRGARFVERALFCPPALKDVKTFAVSAAAGSDEVSLGLEPARPDRVELAPDRLFVQELPGEAATDVVGYGVPVRAGALARSAEPPGEGAALCSERASLHWYFAGGSSTLGVDEHLMIYNPFPDEAVAKVTFLTPTGRDSPGGLSHVPVPSKSSVSLAVNEFIKLERTLGVQIDSVRGRFIAWRTLFDHPDGGPTGTQMTLGATTTTDTWFFPEGGVGPGVEERISLMNPGDEEARVTITLTAGNEIVQPPELVEIELVSDSTTARDLSSVLRGNQQDLGGVSVVVQSTNGVGIVAERTMRYSGDGLSGSAAEIGLPRPSTSWLLPPATLNPETDTVVLMNPGASPATVSLELLYGDRASRRPAQIQDRELAPGGRLKIGIGQWTALETVFVRLTATGPVVAERFSYSATLDDVGSVMGFPLE